MDLILSSYCLLLVYCQSHQISDHQQSWGYEDGPWKGPGPPLLVAADFLFFFKSLLYRICWFWWPLDRLTIGNDLDCLSQLWLWLFCRRIPTNCKKYAKISQGLAPENWLTILEECLPSFSILSMCIFALRLIKRFKFPTIGDPDSVLWNHRADGINHCCASSSDTISQRLRRSGCAAGVTWRLWNYRDSFWQPTFFMAK